MANGIVIGRRMIMPAVVWLTFSIMSCCTAENKTAHENHTYFVGDDAGWVWCCTDYSVWAAQYQFYVGDVLVFVFNPALATVAEVDQDGYNSCLKAFSGTTFTESPTNITLTSSGYKYFISTGQHCTTQRFAINVKSLNSTDSSNNATSTPPPPSPASPSPSSSTNGTTDQQPTTKKDGSSESSALKAKLIGGIVGPAVGAGLAALATGYWKYKPKKKKAEEKTKQLLNGGQGSSTPGHKDLEQSK